MSQRSTSAWYLARISLASSTRASAALTSALATSTTFLASAIRSWSSTTVAFFVPILLDQLGHEEGGEHVALLHLVADVHDPLLDVGGQLGIDRRALVALDEAGLPDDPDDVPDRRVDHLHGRGLRDARELDLGLVAAARRRQGGQETEAGASGGRRNDREPMGQRSRRIRDLQARGRCIRAAALATVPSSRCISVLRVRAWHSGLVGCGTRLLASGWRVAVSVAVRVMRVGMLLAGEDVRVVVRALGVVRVDRRRPGHLLADHEREDRRDDQQGGERRHHQPADHRPAERGLHLAAPLQRQRHRHHAHGHRAGRHQDRPQPLARPDDGRLGRGRPRSSSARR